MIVAVFGDLHGLVLMPFYLASRWQREHGRKIDLALCVGDVGIFSGYERMDKSSKRFARRYPETLGFSRYLYNFDTAGCGKIMPHPAADALFEDISMQLFCVAGNHEEHQFIGDIRYNFAGSEDVPFAVDRDWQGMSAGKYGENEFNGYGRVFILPEGPVCRLSGSKKGGGVQESVPGINLKAVNGLPAYTMPAAWSFDAEKMDILLSHDAYFGRMDGLHPTRKMDGVGSPKLLHLIRQTCPCYHFFGHHHFYYPEVMVQHAEMPPTRSVGLNQLAFNRDSGHVAPGCFGILTVNSPGDMQFEIVEDRWFMNLVFEDCSEFLV